METWTRSLRIPNCFNCSSANLQTLVSWLHREKQPSFQVIKIHAYVLPLLLWRHSMRLKCYRLLGVVRHEITFSLESIEQEKKGIRGINRYRCVNESFLVAHADFLYNVRRGNVNSQPRTNLLKQRCIICIYMRLYASLRCFASNSRQTKEEKWPISSRESDGTIFLTFRCLWRYTDFLCYTQRLHRDSSEDRFSINWNNELKHFLSD